MAHADDMVHITETELEELVCKYAGCIGETKERMVRIDCPQAHGPRVEDGLVAQAAQAGMAVHDVDALAQDDVAENGKEGEDSRKAGRPVENKKGHVVDFKTIGEIAHAGAALVSVGDDDDLVAAVSEFGRQLVNVALDTARLREKEIANHGNVVCGRHGCGLGREASSRARQPRVVMNG